MIKKMVGEMTGTSDIGQIIDSSQFNLTQADDYVFNEDGEVIHFLIQSAKDEYCFTNFALIHVDGDNAMSTKRNVIRYPYSNYTISNVSIETAGKVDRDCEIKFSINNNLVSIDVAKTQIEQLIDLYKILSAISTIQLENLERQTLVNDTMGLSCEVFKKSNFSETSSSEFKHITEYIYDAKLNAHNDVKRKDYKDVFEKYINN